jgi:hypothetical protein
VRAFLWRASSASSEGLRRLALEEAVDIRRSVAEGSPLVFFKRMESFPPSISLKQYREK